MAILVTELAGLRQSRKYACVKTPRHRSPGGVRVRKSGYKYYGVTFILRHVRVELLFNNHNAL